MAATTPAGPASKTDGKSKTKRKSKAARARTNRENAAKSTGPRSAAGKARTRCNAVTHGMTARSSLLTGADAAELDTRKREMVADAQPRNRFEAGLAARIAENFWMSDRARLAADGRVAERLRHHTREQAERERDEALDLGARLFWQPAYPLPISARFRIGFLTEPPVSDHGIHPYYPARIVLRLEQTRAGCDLLLERWNELAERLEFDGLWVSGDIFKMVRLMGKLAADVVDDLEIARVFLCGLTLIMLRRLGPDPGPFDWACWLTKLLSGFDVEEQNGNAGLVATQSEPFVRRLDELPLARLAPAGQAEARQWLLDQIDREMKRLIAIRRELEEIARLDDAEAPARLAVETGHEGELHRRYAHATARQVTKDIETFLKIRAATAAGKFDPRDFDLGDLPAVDGWVDPTRPTAPLPKAAVAEADLQVEKGQRQAIDAVPQPAVGCVPDALPAASRPRRQAIPAASNPPAARGTVAREDSGPEPRPDLAKMMTAPGKSPVITPEAKAPCGDETFLRNEATAHGGGVGETARMVAPRLVRDAKGRTRTRTSPRRGDRERKRILIEQVENALLGRSGFRLGNPGLMPRPG